MFYFSEVYGELKIANLGELTRNMFRALNV